METFFNFIEKYGVVGLRAFHDMLNDGYPKPTLRLARKFSVTPSRISQWRHSCFARDFFCGLFCLTILTRFALSHSSKLIDGGGPPRMS